MKTLCCPHQIRNEDTNYLKKNKQFLSFFAKDLFFFYYVPLYLETGSQWESADELFRCASLFKVKVKSTPSFRGVTSSLSAGTNQIFWQPIFDNKNWKKIIKWSNSINHQPRLSSYVSLRFKESCGRPGAAATSPQLLRPAVWHGYVCLSPSLTIWDEMEKKPLSSTCLNQLSATQARWGWRPRLIAPACLKVWMK